MRLNYIKNCINSILTDKLIYLILYPTGRCNARCSHCYNYDRIKKNNKENELSLEEYEIISEKAGNIPALSITGGEPTLRQEVPDICNLFYKNNNTRYIDFHSNGYLVDELTNMTETILQNNPELYLSLCLSIDGLFNEHDTVRNLKGSFKKVIESISHLKKIKLKFRNRLNLKTATIYSRSSHKNFLKTIKYLSKLGIQNESAFIRGEVSEPDEKRLTLKSYIKFINYRIKNRVKYDIFSLEFLFHQLSFLIPETVINTVLKKKQIYNCFAGKSLMVIYENGDISVCELRNDNLGNIRDYQYDINKVFTNLKTKEILKSISAKECYCTWENMIIINYLKNLKFYPVLFFKIIKNILTNL